MPLVLFAAYAERGVARRVQPQALKGRQRAPWFFLNRSVSSKGIVEAEGELPAKIR
jgi:hypothetical protein